MGIKLPNFNYFLITISNNKNKKLDIGVQNFTPIKSCEQINSVLTINSNSNYITPTYKKELVKICKYITC